MCNSEDCRTTWKSVKLNNVPCEDWLLMGLRYQHADPHSPDIDYVTVRLDLKDTRSGSIYKVKYGLIYGSRPLSFVVLLLSGLRQYATSNTLWTKPLA